MKNGSIDAKRDESFFVGGMGDGFFAKKPSLINSSEWFEL
jgi:hypothetical protein